MTGSMRKNLPVGRASSAPRIVLYPDPVLKRRCASVEDFGPGPRKLAEHMLRLMHQAEGVGLAAPQVGVSLRLFVCNVTPDPAQDRVFVNPRFLDLSGADESAEGCLSLPGVNVAMRRASRAVMEAQDLDGRFVQVTAEGLLARVWQHETDHLDGILIIDHMSAADAIANRKAIRQLKADFRPGKRK
jgi:peptide deformylase